MGINGNMNVNYITVCMLYLMIYRYCLLYTSVIDHRQVIYSTNQCLRIRFCK